MPRRSASPDAALMRMFHPVVSAWFRDTFGGPSEPQRSGWPAIASGEHALILAPTGTGKTLAAFLWEIDRLIARGLDAPLPNAVQILYISPLKALSNDIHRNLEVPLAELRRRFEESGQAFPDIRVAVRTGDTPAAARASMLRRAPHVLITTPESLHIMLTTVKGRGMFSMVRAVIVDEIHAVAGTKRGAHLALSLERLDALCEAPPQRIGLSATQRPLDEIARYLGGCAARGESEAPTFRPVRIIDCGLVKRMALEIASPAADGTMVPGVWPKVAELAVSHIRGARTTLIFVNNRGQAERMAARINAFAAEDLARPYHGSLSRERRLGLERSLKAGELRALVTTSSLELGIDIGSVDLVLQLQSPKRVSAGLQRVGRAGHSLGESSRGVFVPTFRDDLLEMAAIVEAMREGDVEPTRVPQNALDVLAQILVAMASVDDWTTADAFALVRRAYPYHKLGRSAFDEVLLMLAGAYPAEVTADMQPRLTWDRVADTIRGTRASRMVAVVSGGTIPDRGLYTAVLPDRTRLGELDEEFVHESRVGDVFQLGSATWRIGAIEHDRVIVTPAPGAPARMPFWHGEYSARAASIGWRVGALRRELAALAPEDEAGLTALAARLGADPASTSELRDYVAEQRAATGVVPDERTVVVERFRDEMGAVRIVIHSVFGGRVNAPWGMALAQRIRDALDGAECQVQTSDDGILLRLPETGATLDVPALLRLTASDAEHRLLNTIGNTSLFGARFRMNAARALVLARGAPRRRMPLWLQRLRALDLLDAVRGFPTFPLLVETYREVLDDAFDLPALRGVLDALGAGRITIRAVDTDGPSPFAAGLQLGFVMAWLYADDSPRAERQAALLSVDRSLLGDILTDGLLGGEVDDETTRAIEEVVADRRGTSERRRARNADELAHLLDRAGDLTLDELRARTAAAEERTAPGDPVEALLASKRAVFIAIPDAADAVRWRAVLVETFPRYAAAFGEEAVARVRIGAGLEEVAADAAVPDAFRHPSLEPRAAKREILAKFVSLAGPVTAAEIGARYGWANEWVTAALADWERAGRLVRGRFRAGVRDTEWCLSGVVERARRRALAALRRQISAVDLGTFGAFLRRWQHVDPRDRLTGSAGLESAMHQLSGLPQPPDRWERDTLPSRLDRYDAAWLSQLASSGELMWAGSARPVDNGMATLAAIRFFARGEEGIWLAAAAPNPLSADAQRVRGVLAQRGASFFGDLQSATALGAAALRDAIRELVANGIATNDTVEAMREVVRTRPLPQRPARTDPTRWRSDVLGSSSEAVVQQRVSAYRLPKWRRPDVPGPQGGWVGRWSLIALDTGARPPEEEHAEMVARRWLDRYGVVTSDWWRRERPPISWRSIYRELKRLEHRGEIRRGYFVEGMAGAQFALPAAVELLRGVRDETADRDVPMVALAGTDPANVYNLRLPTRTPTPLENPRGPGAVLVFRGTSIVMSAESSGRHATVRPEADDADVTAAARLLAEYVQRRRSSIGLTRRRYVLERIDGAGAAASRWAGAFAAAGYRRIPRGLEFEPLAR